MDISKLKIDTSKMLANGDEYFDLYEKHIPRGLGKDELVLVYEIQNLDCIVQIIGLNPEAGYIVVGHEASNQALKMMLDENIDVQYLNSLELKDCNMKFDCIIMNPPYSKNLHLKILAEAIQHLKDDKSVVVNLSPVRWLQDPLAKYKKTCDLKRFEDSIYKHIASVDVIDIKDAQDVFNDAVMGAALGIYVCRKLSLSHNISLVESFVTRCLDKLVNTGSIAKFDSMKKDGIRVRIPLLINSGGNGVGRAKHMNNFGKMLWFEDGMRDEKTWYDCYRHNQYMKTTAEIPSSIKFNSKLEAENFCKTYDLDFVKVYTHFVKSDVHITPMMILWLGDVINPRTGLKGYQGEWTDDDLYKFFNITDEEKKIIEETMKKYK